MPGLPLGQGRRRPILCPGAQTLGPTPFAGLLSCLAPVSAQDWLSEAISARATGLGTGNSNFFHFFPGPANLPGHQPTRRGRAGVRHPRGNRASLQAPTPASGAGTGQAGPPGSLSEFEGGTPLPGLPPGHQSARVGVVAQFPPSARIAECSAQNIGCAGSLVLQPGAPAEGGDESVCGLLLEGQSWAGETRPPPCDRMTT
jgi:hypothetical protein